MRLSAAAVAAAFPFDGSAGGAAKKQPGEKGNADDGDSGIRGWKVGAGDARVEAPGGAQPDQQDGPALPVDEIGHGKRNDWKAEEQQELQRAETLVEKGWTTREKYDQRKQELDSATAALTAATKAIDEAQGSITFIVDNAALVVSADNIDKARIMPDWVALGLAPSKPTGPAPKRPKPNKNSSSNEPAAKKPRAE